MRYEKGTIQISPARDIPLLQQVLRSGFATSDQLYEFMQLNQSERSRQAFDHRLRRLLAHGLIEKHQGAARGRPQVFVISRRRRYAAIGDRRLAATAPIDLAA